MTSWSTQTKPGSKIDYRYSKQLYVHSRRAYGDPPHCIAKYNREHYENTLSAVIPLVELPSTLEEVEDICVEQLGRPLTGTESTYYGLAVLYAESWTAYVDVNMSWAEAVDKNVIRYISVYD